MSLENLHPVFILAPLAGEAGDPPCSPTRLDKSLQRVRRQDKTASRYRSKSCFQNAKHGSRRKIRSNLSSLSVREQNEELRTVSISRFSPHQTLARPLCPESHIQTCALSSNTSSLLAAQKNRALTFLLRPRALEPPIPFPSARPTPLSQSTRPHSGSYSATAQITPSFLFCRSFWIQVAALMRRGIRGCCSFASASYHPVYLPLLTCL